MMDIYQERREINTRALIIRKSRPCQDCKLSWHPSIMTLDHPGRKGKYKNANGKTMHPSRMLTYDPLAFKNMIEACDVVCMNCHALREMKRDGVLNRSQWQKFNNLLTEGALIEPY